MARSLVRFRNQAKEYAALKVWRRNNPDKVKACAKRYYEKTKGEVNAKRRQRYASDPKKRMQHKLGNLAWYYGISPEQYFRLLEEQKGLCAICKNPPEQIGRKKNLHMDHDHETDSPRGLLCSHCNVALGLAKEDPKILRAMADYLEEWDAKIPN